MLEVRLLGQFHVQGDGQPIPLASRPAQLLLAYLLLHAGTPQPRDKLVGLLWPDAPEANARRNLRQALWHLRRAFAPRPSAGLDYLLTDDLTVAFNAHSDYWQDVAVLDVRLEEASSAEDLLRAVAVYRGEFLPGFYEDWVILERERLQAVFEQKMHQLLDRLVEERRWAEVVEWGERWIALCRSPEPAYRAVMRAHSAQGDMAGLATVFQRCVQALRDDLGVEPSEQTRALYERLAKGELPPGAPAETPFHTRYRLGDEIGRGGMAVVYQAQDTRLERAVAVKVLHDPALGPEGRARLVREAQAVAQLNHPNIVSVYDAGEAEGAPFLVMELVRGTNLRDSGPWSLPQIVDIARQLCEALDHAHGQGIIHRDVKPENILVCRMGEQWVVKLMDFGLARSRSAPRLTQAGTVVGTVFYLAPEQARGDEVDGRTDLYALGVVLYELVAGRLPFTGEDPVAILAQHLHAPVVPPRTYNAAIPPRLDALILKLLAKNPAERFASARAVALALAEVAAAGGAPTVSPLTLAGPRHNLPVQLTSFIGREKELADVKKLLHDAPMLMLVGPGGTGKTRLSIQAASELLDQYPDGVWLVQLAPLLDPLLVPRITAIAIGLRDEPQRPVIDMLCDYLRDKQMLIVLDNCEHLVDACAQMADRILHAAPKARILASSREALGIAGEVTYQVPSLGLPDLEHLPSVESLSQYEAVKLFIDRATAAVSTFTVTNDNAPALAQICHRLDGIPLAIELAAAKIRVLSLDQIAKRLGDRFRLLTGGSRTALERHQTLRAAIDWSYNLLAPAEQTLFRRLSIFVGGWTLEAAESVCDDAATSSMVRSEDLLDLLEQLIHKSLVITEEMGHESRYRMLETMRQYANEKLVKAGESDALRDRQLDYFLQLAETAAPHLTRPEQLEWLAQLDADYENLRLALEWALSQESPELSLRLCAALGKFWHIRSYWLEGSKWLKSALAKPSRDPRDAEKAARVKALYHDAELANKLDDLERMRISAELSLALAQEGSDKRDIAIARYYAGLALYRRDDDEHARLLMEQSLVEFRELDDPYWESRSYYRITDYFGEQNYQKYPEATVVHTVELARKAGERLNLAGSLDTYGFCLYFLNQMDNAKKCAEEALLILEQMGSQMNFQSLLLAEIAWFSGDYEKVRSLYAEVKERFSLLGSIYTTSHASMNLGLLAIEENDLSKAQAYMEEALMIMREVKFGPQMARCLICLGYVSYLQGNIEKFKQHSRESISIANERSQNLKSEILGFLLIPISNQLPESSARILGVIDFYEREIRWQKDPWAKRYLRDRAEAHARKVLGEAAFESAFAEGQKMSLDEALDLALKTVEEM